MAVLYTRIDDGLHDKLKRFAEENNLSLRVVTESVLANTFGIRHSLWPAVRRALRDWEDEKQ